MLPEVNIISPSVLEVDALNGMIGILVMSLLTIDVVYGAGASYHRRSSVGRGSAWRGRTVVPVRVGGVERVGICGGGSVSEGGGIFEVQGRVERGVWPLLVELMQSNRRGKLGPI